MAFEFRLAPIMRIQNGLKPIIIKQCEHGKNKIIEISRSAYSYPGKLVLHINIQEDFYQIVYLLLSNTLIHLFNIYLSTLECSRHLLNLTYVFLHLGTPKKVNKPKQLWHMLRQIHVGGKRRHQIVPTGKGQYQLGKQHCSHADKGNSTKQSKENYS